MTFETPAPGAALEPVDPHAGQPYAGAWTPLAGPPVTPPVPAPYPMSTPYPATPYPSTPYPAMAPGPESYGFAPYGYPPYGSPQRSRYGRPGPARPGAATAAAVLGFVQAGLLTISALFVYAGASLIDDAASSAAVDNGGIPAQLVLAGTADLLAAALFVVGGAALCAGRRAGRGWLVSAVVLTSASALFWIIRFQSNTVVVWAIVFLALPTILTVLMFRTGVHRWLDTARGAAAA